MPPFIDLQPIEKAVPKVQCLPGGPNVPLVECYTIANIVSLIFKFVINLSAAIFLVLLLYGGFVYLTAGGTDENVEKAKKIMTQALIGLVIVASAYGVGIWTLKALGISSQIAGSNPITGNGTTTANPGNKTPTATTPSPPTGTVGIPANQIVLGKISQADIEKLLSLDQPGTFKSWIYSDTTNYTEQISNDVTYRMFVNMCQSPVDSSSEPLPVSAITYETNYDSSQPAKLISVGCVTILKKAIPQYPVGKVKYWFVPTG